ncbi:DBH-like monooxygenase protein 1 homolog isoform X2 [Styela clava]
MILVCSKPRLSQYSIIMALCRRCFLFYFALQMLSSSLSISLMDTPIMVDYTHLMWNLPSMDSVETPDKMKFDQYVTLSEDGTVKLAWNFTDDKITFKLSAQTHGWIGVGFAKTQVGNTGADFIVAGDKSQSNYYVADMHVDKNGEYAVDKVQDVSVIAVWEDQDETYAIFSRPLVSCDHDQDVEITSDTLRIIWGVGAVDPRGSEPERGELIPSKSGSLNIKLLNPMNPALDINSPDSVETFDLKLDNIHVELGEYRHCTVFRFPEITTKRHIVQFEPIITEGNEYNVRQITIRQCTRIDQSLSATQQATYNCDEATSCKTIVLTWSIGMTRFTYPDEVGYPVEEDATYFMMEIRYVNPQIEGLIDSSGLRIYYTSQLRQYDAGVMSTGSLVHESQIIPPRSTNFLLQGHCMTECLTMALPHDGHVTIFAALLHAREAGRKIKLRHFRDGEELTPVAEDNSFLSLHQETQFLGQKIELHKRDNMIVECTYDTYDRNDITYVNNSKGGESCLAFLSYFPRTTKLTECETAPTENVIMSTVGAARPEEMGKIAERFEWTSQQTREYNNRLLQSKVYVHCGGSLLQGPRPIPAIKKVFVEEHKCRSDKLLDTTTVASNQTTTDSGAGANLPLGNFVICVLIFSVLLSYLLCS